MVPLISGTSSSRSRAFAFSRRYRNSGSSLRRGAITHIPPSIADLEGFIILPSTHSPSSAPPSPTLAPARPFTRATTLAATQFDAPFFRSRDGERLRGTPAARAASLQAVVQPATAQRRRRDIQIYLANNSISRLPPELFRVNALTVLSLRASSHLLPTHVDAYRALLRPHRIQRPHFHPASNRTAQSPARAQPRAEQAPLAPRGDAQHAPHQAHRLRKPVAFPASAPDPGTESSHT